MAIALDFGTCNTVLARWNEATGRADLVAIPGLSRHFDFRLPGEAREQRANVIPTLIHYGQADHRLLGDQVAREGLVDHRGTFRWVKLDLLQGNDRPRRANGALRRPSQAAGDFLGDVLMFGLGALGGEPDEELVLTVPVEAYDHYVDWLRGTVEAVAGSRRVRLLDEATACILGYQETVRNDDVYMIVDFGGGTLDVSLVRVNLGGDGLQKCVIRGRAGEELGGMLVDHWMLERMKEVEELSEEDIREVGTPLLRGIEDAKIALSSGAESADVTQLNDLTGRLVSHTFTAAELRSILEGKDFTRLVARTLERAMDAANEKYRVRKRDIRRVFMVGGTSLLLGVRELVAGLMPDVPVECHEPFGAIAGGACRYLGQDFDPTLVHDYEIKRWNPERKDFEFVVVIPKGTQYPTDGAVKGLYIFSACDQARELNQVVFEHSEQVRPGSVFIMGPDGRMQEQKTAGERIDRRRALNPDAQDFIRPDPPCDRDQTKRFVVGFGVDENKRLTVSIKDTLPGNESKVRTSDGRMLELPLRDYPLVRL